MIYSLCDIAGKDRATDKPIVSTCVMDMQMQLLRYFRDYGLDNDSDWRKSLDAILESQREDGCFPLSSNRHMPSDARVDFLYRPTYVCCQIMMRALLGGKLSDEQSQRVKISLSRGLAFSCGRGLNGHGIEDLERQCEDVADFGHAGITEIVERYPLLCPEFFSLINKIGDEYVERIANGHVIYYFGSNLAQKILTAAESLGRTNLQLDKIQRYLDDGHAEKNR